MAVKSTLLLIMQTLTVKNHIAVAVYIERNSHWTITVVLRILLVFYRNIIRIQAAELKPLELCSLRKPH